MKTVVVVGNPRLHSRTAEAASLVASALGGGAVRTIELAEFGPALLDWGNPEVADAKRTVQAADLVVVASPTFKATYTGLMKLFLDQFESGSGMAGITAVPLMLGAGERYSLAPDLLLKPVLVELGATCPTAGLYLLDSDYASSVRLHDWLDQWGDVVLHTAARLTPTGRAPGD